MPNARIKIQENDVVLAFCGDERERGEFLACAGPAAHGETGRRFRESWDGESGGS